AAKRRPSRESRSQFLDVPHHRAHGLARLHPLDSAFTQAFTILPLFLLGYDGPAFAGAAVFVTVLAIPQHANVRFPVRGVRWVVNTPEWHHWHRAIDPEARNKNCEGSHPAGRLPAPARVPVPFVTSGTLPDSPPTAARRVARVLRDNQVDVVTVA